MVFPGSLKKRRKNNSCNNLTAAIADRQNNLVSMDKHCITIGARDAGNKAACYAGKFIKASGRAFV